MSKLDYILIGVVIGFALCMFTLVVTGVTDV